MDFINVIYLIPIETLLYPIRLSEDEERLLKSRELRWPLPFGKCKISTALVFEIQQLPAPKPPMQGQGIDQV